MDGGRDGKCSRERWHKLELLAELEAHTGSHVVATNVLRVAVLDSGGGMHGWC